MVKKFFVALSTLALLAGVALAQDAKTVLQNATKAIGDVKSIQFSGTGHLSAVGQAWNPTSPWPETIVKSYTKTIDYGSQSAREELVRNEGDPPAKGGAAPFGGDQRQVNLVSGQYAWNQPGNAPQPAVAAAEERQLQIWLTPHGFLNGAMQNGATAKKGKGGTEVTFTAMGKFKVTGTIDSQGMVAKTETRFPNPVLGDMLVETDYSGYKDFGGVKFPATIVQKQGGYPLLDLAVTDVKANVPLDLSVPDPVKQAKLPPVVVQSQKLGEGLWWLGGGSHHSVVVEYPTYITVIESPLSDERAVAVIAEAKKLVPNKPIKYLVNTHNHFDHLGGVRGFIAEGNITVITNEMNKPYYEKIFKAPHTLAPDRLSQNPKKATYITVKDKYVLSDGGREIDIIHLGDNHNEGMLVVYIPKEKVLVEADAFTPPAPNGPAPAPRALAFTKNLNANIERLKLDVVTVAPLHGFVVSVAELKKLAGTT
jgi:glyoxylase-like metal-dependent hydrolase (beta-lactamase superfamily II)